MNEYWHKTKDGKMLRLTRFYNPSWKSVKGPILLIPGLGSSRNVYMSDCVNQSFVECLCMHEFDTWIMDTRSSCDLICHNQYILDDIIQNDFNSAIPVILQVSHCKDFIVLAHCVGSITFVSALLAGLQ